MAYPKEILEEQLKKEVARDLFPQFDTTRNIGRIDFCAALPPSPLFPGETVSLLWAEAKRGTGADLRAAMAQLILTIGRERPHERMLPPAFLGAFDAGRIAFLPYSAILGTLAQNDFNWNVPPSDHSTREFRQLMDLTAEAADSGMETYRYDEDARELAHFIRHHFTQHSIGDSHIRISRNNFINIYLKWAQAVQPTIAIDWEAAKKGGILAADFYLADILSENNSTLKEKLYVLLRSDHYELDREVDAMGLFTSKRAQFTDGQRAHREFWKLYSRPPQREYWDYMVLRRELLVPQDVRERKGSYFTPRRWVELSQEYIARELGDDWQDTHYVWDCCAGTGNLLVGLENKHRIFASTLDKADVDVMRDRIAHGANLVESHVFQFDFLNDPLLDTPTQKSKLPQTLQEIIRDPERRRKLVIYINPPYAEAGDIKQTTGTGKNKDKVATSNATYLKYKAEIKAASNELFAQFFIRIYREIEGSWLAQFSTLERHASLHHSLQASYGSRCNSIEAA